MNKYIFTSQTHWTKILLLIAALTGCGGTEQNYDPPIDPIPVGCPNSLGEMTLRCDNDFNTPCRYDATGQISAERTDPLYKCELVQCAAHDCSFWIVLELAEGYDSGAIKNPVNE